MKALRGMIITYALAVGLLAMIPATSAAQVRDQQRDQLMTQRMEQIQDMLHRMQMLTERSRQMNDAIRLQLRQETSERAQEQYRMLGRMGESIESACRELTTTAERLQVMQHDRDMLRDRDMDRDMDQIREHLQSTSEQVEETLRLMDQLRTRMSQQREAR